MLYPDLCRLHGIIPNSSYIAILSHFPATSGYLARAGEEVA